ncbi:MAG: hypothetical protein NVSMB9_26100 [Isosphaeraceae bacterium]
MSVTTIPRQPWLKLGLLALLILGADDPAATEKAALRWKFKEGETLRYEFFQRNEIKIRAGDKETENKTELTIDMSWKVKEVASDGAASILLKIDRARVVIQSGPQKTLYDSNDREASNDPASQILNTVYRAAVGQDYALKVDSRGKVVEATVPSKVTEALRGSPFLAAADGGSVLSDKGLKNMFAQIIPVFPEHKVAQGDSWKLDLELPVKPLGMKMVFNNVLSSLDATRAKVSAKVDISLIPEPDISFQVKVKNQSGNGTFLHDEKLGHLTESSIKQTVTLTLEFMKKEIEQVIHVDETMKLRP